MSTYNAIRYNNPYTNAGSLILLSTQTASASSSISFTTGIDSTYKEYLFILNNIHPSTDSVAFKFNMSSDGGSNYNVTKTTTSFRAYHDEADTATNLGYDTGQDLAQSTAYQTLVQPIGNLNDESTSGYLHLFNPSSNVFVKHFLANFNGYHDGDLTINYFTAGYGNTTSAINALDFQFASGNIDAGTIQMFGVVS